MELVIKTAWGYEVCYNSFASNSRGKAILHNNFYFQMNERIADQFSNLLASDVRTAKQKICLIYIYGPTRIPLCMKICQMKRKDNE